MANTSVDNLAKELGVIIDQEGMRIRGATEDVVRKVSAKTVVNLKNNSPKRTGAYAKDWTFKVKKEAYLFIGAVFNQKHYRLTHLLNNGHAKRNGGRVEGDGHITKAQEEAGEQLINELTREIE